jgi:hypothetical protein
MICDYCNAKRLILNGAYLRGWFLGFCCVCNQPLSRRSTQDACPPGTPVGQVERRGNGFCLVKQNY